MFTIHDLEKQRNESKAWIVVGKMKKNSVQQHKLVTSMYY